MARDPLKNPAPGDVVRAKDGRERRVTDVDVINGRTTVRYEAPYRGKSEGHWRIWITGWRAWCRMNQAEVVTAAQEAK